MRLTRSAVQAVRARPEFSAALDDALMDVQIRLEAFAIDYRSDSPRGKRWNVRETLGLTKGDLSTRNVLSEMELYALFPVKPVNSITMYRSAIYQTKQLLQDRRGCGCRGALEIGDMMQLSVRVFKKTAREGMPSPSPYSMRCDHT